MVEKFLARPTDGFNKSTLIYRFHTAVYVSIPRTVCQLASCQLKRKQGKKVCKATALRSCHCFPCTMLSVLSRPNSLWEKKSYSAQLLKAAERCKKKRKRWLSVPFSFCCKLSPTAAMTITGNQSLVRGSTNPTRSKCTMSSMACLNVASRPCWCGKKMAMINDF